MARAIDEDVEASVLSDDLLDGRGDLIVIRHIDRHRLRSCQVVAA
jgi:hypothetical protein